MHIPKRLYSELQLGSSPRVCGVGGNAAARATVDDQDSQNGNLAQEGKGRGTPNRGFGPQSSQRLLQFSSCFYE